MTSIVIKSLSKKIKNNMVLDDVNLTFEGGHIYGLVGGNGSGKTMLLRAICGLIFPDEGTITINSKQMHKDISFPPSCGVIIENTELLPNFSAFDNLRIIAKIRNTATEAMMREALCKVGIKPDSKEKVRTFSLGMKQRLSIAQALFEDPNILLLDEPTNALDEEGIYIIRDILAKEREKGKLIIIASHNKDDISLLADTVIRVENGRFIANVTNKITKGEIR